MAILSRIGRKPAWIAKKIEQYFPANYDFYVEPFFGAGGMFFKKKYQSKYAILNDLDEDVYNFFNVLKNNPKELLAEIQGIPLHEKIFYDFVKKTEFKNEIEKAATFFYLSRCSFMGDKRTFNTSIFGEVTLKKEINEGFLKLCSGCTFLCCDFRDFFKKTHLREEKDYKERSFV